MGGVPSPKQAAPVSPWPLALAQAPAQAGTKQAWGNAEPPQRLHHSLDSNRGSLSLGTQGFSSSYSHRDHPF